MPVLCLLVLGLRREFLVWFNLSSIRLRHLFNVCQYLNIVALIMRFRHSQVRNTVVVVVVVIVGVVVLDFGKKNTGMIRTLNSSLYLVT